MRAVAVLSLLLVVSFQVAGQDTVRRDPASPTYLVRIDRLTSGTEACVLVRRDGNYHYERDNGEKAEIFEGDLSSSELVQVRQWVEDDAMQRLSQENIPSPLIVSDVDKFLLAIFRGYYWQNLAFPDAESRKPYQRILAPMMAWLESLRKSPHRELPEDEAKNNCLPPGKIEFAIRRRDSPATSKEPASPSPPSSNSPLSKLSETSPATPAGRLLLMRFVTDHVRDGEVSRNCVIVRSGGRYHAEKSSQEFRSPMKSASFEGSLNNADLDSLRQILNDSDLANTKSEHMPEGIAGREWEVNILSIARSEGIQQLATAEVFGTASWTRQARNLTSKNVKVLRPLQAWVKTRIDTDKSKAVKGAVPNNCVYEP